MKQEIGTSDSPKISVVIPTYNASSFLRAALNSLVTQPYKNLEIICVNDGSTDDSLDILREYAAKDSRFIIISGPNGGYGKAMNKGMQAATGKYFAIFEPDDLLPNDAYSEMIKIAEAQKLDFIKGSTVTFSENRDGKKVYTNRPPQPIVGQVICPRKKATPLFYLHLDTWNGIYNMEFLRKYNVEYYESPGASYQDTGFFLQTHAFAERVMYISHVTYMYRLDNPESSSNNICKKMFALRDEFQFIKRKMEQYPGIWQEMKPFFLRRRVGAHRWVFWSLLHSQRMNYLIETRKEFMEYEEYSRAYLREMDHIHFREILVAPEFFLLNESLRQNAQQKKDETPQKDENLKKSGVDSNIILLAAYPLMQRKRNYYRFMSFISFGRRKKKYLEKKAKVERFLQKVKELALF